MKWVYIVIVILLFLWVGRKIEEYSNRGNIQIIQGGVEP